MLTDYTILEIYLKDLNVPIAYIILTLGIFTICYKKMPILRIIYLWLLSGFALAFLFDGVYDFQYYLTITQTFKPENMIFAVYFVPLVIWLMFIKRYGELNRCFMLFSPIIGEILLVSTMKNFSSELRYWYVISFLYIIIFIKDKKNVKPMEN